MLLSGVSEKKNLGGKGQTGKEGALRGVKRLC